MRLKVRFTTLYDNSKTKRVAREEVFPSDGSPEREQAIRKLVESRDPNAQITSIEQVDERLVFGNTAVVGG